MDDKSFAVAVNLIEQLVADESKRSALLTELAKMRSEMTDEQLAAFKQYQTQMIKTTEQDLDVLRQKLADAEAELMRRKTEK